MSAPGDEERRDEEHRPLHGEEIDEVHDAALGEHRERQEQQEGCAQVEELEVERDTGHGQTRSSRCTRSPSTAKRKAVARNSGARKTRSFADTVSSTARSAPATASLAASTGIEARSATGALSRVERPQGMNKAKPMQA